MRKTTRQWLLAARAVLLHLATDELYNCFIPSENIRPTLNWSGRLGPQDDVMLLVGAGKKGRYSNLGNS